MHLTHSLALTLPTLALAQSQKPLGEQVQGWFDKAKSYIPNSVPTAVKEPVGAGAAEVAAKTVTPLSISNYEEWLTPDPSSTLSPQTYMVLVTGGNKTCVGQCGKIEKAWNESVSLLAADPTAPHLGYINCDNEGPLCATWQAQPPTIWHIQRPIAKADQSAPASTVYINYLNVTTTSAKDIVALHSGQRYEEGILYEGYFQPFDGVLAQYGVNKAVGYVLYAFGLVPSWTFMLVISMVSRTFMSRRNAPLNNQPRATQPGGGAAPAN